MRDDERSAILPPTSIPPTSGRVEERTSYDGITTTLAKVYTPKTHAELAARLSSFSHPDKARRVTIAAGLQSIDAQALGDQVVIQMGGEELGRIGAPQRDERGPFVTLGAAAPWGDVVLALSEHGLLPCSVVTTAHATAGGTISADCLSRSSPLTGREGVHVRSFKLVTVDGRTIECRRDDPDPSRRRLFQAAIGGFGYLGVIAEVTIDLRPAPPEWTPGTKIQVATRCDKHIVSKTLGGTWDDLLPRLREREAEADLTDERPSVVSRILHAFEGSPKDPAPPRIEPWDAVSSAAWFALGRMETLLFRSRYVVGRELHPLPIYQHSSKLMDLLTLASVTPALAELGETALFALHPSGLYVDALDDFTFFMEHQIAPARELAGTMGFRLNTIQQTFVLPARSTPDDPSGIGPTKQFLEEIRPVLFGGSNLPAMLEPLRPTLIDVLFLPADDFLLSATRGMDGFAVTLSFTERNEDGWDTLKERLLALSRVCHDLGGRIHLIKDVVADQPVLEAMYGGAFEEFRALKRAYDPLGVLENAFYDRIFGR